MLKEVVRKNTPSAVIDYYHRLLSFLGVLWYRFPSRKLVVIGVTGTKGKTTATHLIAGILEDAGYKVGMASSVCFKIGKKVELNKTKMTMPGRFRLQKLLRRMVFINCRYAVVEVTSEGIRQHRHRWIDFDTLVFTNISSEHLESHGSFAQYLAAKQEIFRDLAASRREKRIKKKPVRIEKCIVVNGDDEHAEDFLAFPADRKYRFHIGAHDADGELSVCEDITARVDEVSAQGAKFTVRGQNFTQALPGRFNVENALAAVTVGISEGVALSEMAETLARAETVPGRMEYIDERQSFTLIVDYAHTPSSLEAVYKMLCQSDAGAAGRLIAVLGAAGGGRDRWKRPVLGAIAGMYADEVIITNEDPYDEDPLAIMHEVGDGAEHARDVYGEYAGKGMLKNFDVRTLPTPRYILDRQEAIEKACTMAREGDTVIITGKGAEPLLAVTKGKKIPWDDRAVARAALKKVLAA